MATDGPNPKPCDPEVFTEGVCVLITHSIPPNAMDEWVRKVAETSSQRVDWYFAGGRAVVKAIGDLKKVRAALEKLRAEHDTLFRKAVAKLALGGFAPAPPWYTP
jgi:hypothetical protein